MITLKRILRKLDRTLRRKDKEVTVKKFLEEIQGLVDAGKLSEDARVLIEDEELDMTNVAIIVDSDGDLIIF